MSAVTALWEREAQDRLDELMENRFNYDSVRRFVDAVRELERLGTPVVRVEPVRQGG
jgi:hypothetical protein